MSNEFKREDRYIVFKLSDVERYLTDADRTYLAMMKNEIDAGRDCANKPPFKGLIVESDWPEYEPTWKAIEARVTGAQLAPSALAEAIIADMQAQHDSELITENDSGEALIRLDGAIAAVEDNFALAQPTPSAPEGWKLVPIEPTQEMRDAWDSSPICEDDAAEFRCAYYEMLAAAPEVKP